MRLLCIQSISVEYLKKRLFPQTIDLSDLRQPGSKDIRFGRRKTFPMCVVAFIIQTAVLSQVVHMRPATIHNI
jgi:hypothetical protein